MDEGGLFRPAEARQLEELLLGIRQRSGVEISVYVPASLQGKSIEEFSIAVAEAWKLGRKKEDKGLLLIIAPKERKMRLEVGYGLEGQLTDLHTRRILDGVLRPRLRAGESLQGVLATLGAIQEKVPLGLEPQNGGGAGDELRLDLPPLSPALIFLLFILFILLIVVLSIIRFLQFVGLLPRARSYGGWHSGGWGGGSRWGGGSGRGGGISWGGGGGGFGGGGASSDW